MLVRKEYNTDGTWVHMSFRNGGYVCELFGRDAFGDVEVKESSRHTQRKTANEWMDSKVKRP